MTITLTSLQLAGLAYGTAQRNASNPAAVPMTEAQFAADILGVRCDEWAAAQEAADRAGLAEDPEMIALGIAVKAQPQKFGAIKAAVLAILEAP